MAKSSGLRSQDRKALPLIEITHYMQMVTTGRIVRILKEKILRLPSHSAHIPIHEGYFASANLIANIKNFRCRTTREQVDIAK